MAWKKRTAALAVPLSALALLTACTPTGGTAAVVDKVRISESDITRYAEGCASVTGANGIASETAASLRSTVVSWSVQELLVQKVAAMHHVTIDPAARDAAFSSTPVGKALATNADCREAAVGAIDLSLLAQQLDPATVIRDAQTLNLQLNPRYGSWDYTSMTASGSGSLSQPVTG